jgi:hypothetical protein
MYRSCILFIRAYSTAYVVLDLVRGQKYDTLLFQELQWLVIYTLRKQNYILMPL